MPYAHGLAKIPMRGIELPQLANRFRGFSLFR
ncbi:MAG: hypothetical protein ACI97A_003810, partial [Planctomycetota bacterium]